MLKKAYCKFLIPLLLLIQPIAHASMDGWYATGKLGGRVFFSEKHNTGVAFSSLGLNVAYQFSKPFSVEVGLFSGGSTFYSATENQNVDYDVSHIVTGIKSIFWSNSTFDAYTKVGLGWALFSQENTGRFLSAVTQIGGRYFITPEIPVGLSLSLISTISTMFLISIDVSYYFG